MLAKGDATSKHKWVWIRRWTFQCEKCGKFGEFDDGYIMESE